MSTNAWCTMEPLIKCVEKHPCLWNTEVEEYKFQSARDAAWRDVAEECGFPDVKEAQYQWRKLRDGHRQALSAKRTTSKRPWKYEKLMEYLLPVMTRRTKPSNENMDDFNPHKSDVSYNDDDSSESDQYQRSDDIPPTKKPNITPIVDKRRRDTQSIDRDVRPDEIEIRFDEQDIQSDEQHAQNGARDTGIKARDISRRQTQIPTSSNNVTLQNAALENFFTSMYLTTNSLPEILQLRVQRQVFNVVMEAKEEFLNSLSASGDPLDPHEVKPSMF